MTLAVGTNQESLIDESIREKSSQALCTHCGQAMPKSFQTTSVEKFCCAGCEAVWLMLHECGLEKYYAMQTAEGSSPNRPHRNSSQAYLDHAEFQSRHVQTLDDDRLRAELRLDGLKCGACLWLLEALPRLERGLMNSRVDLGRSVIALEWVSAQTSLSKIAQRIAALGYQVRPIGTLASRQEWRRQDRIWLIDIAVAGAISGNVMAIAFALYGAQFSWMDDPTRQFLQWTSVLLAAIAVLWPGRLFLRNAMNAIRARRPHMDLPIALALAAGLIGGAATTIAGRSGVYFESISMLVFLLLVGRFVQFRQQRSARHEIELICALVPQTARRVSPDGSLEEIPTDALRLGDQIEIPAGESVSADGLMQSAYAHFDMQLLTGESCPVRRNHGECVFAGVRLLGESPIRIDVTASGSKTRAAGIAQMVEDAIAKRPPTVEFANRIAGWFLLVVVVMAIAVGICWWFIDPSRVPSVVVAMLVVTCPCALGLATPLTMVSSLGKAARAGILIRGGDVLERIAKRGTIVLDKTGTVTEGSMRVMSVVGDCKSVRLAALLEAHSAHPVGKAIVEHWHNHKHDSLFEECASLATPVVCDVQEFLGQGIAGTIDGQRLEVGSVGFVTRSGATCSAELLSGCQSSVVEGFSPALIALDGVVVAVLAIGDPVRIDAADFVRGLQMSGWSVWLASGDLSQITNKVGSALGIAPSQVRGACTPEEKVSIIHSQVLRPVVMVGDGVNDLPAMAAADVGIAVRQGAQATIAHADVALTGGGLRQVMSLIERAQRTMRTIHINFAISIAYNAIGGTLAALGLISPFIAAVLMPLSGLTVTAVALRMPRFSSSADPLRSGVRQ